jgi:signal transduction histidine kinase/ActR/RegA family two-component response regulator
LPCPGIAQSESANTEIRASIRAAQSGGRPVLIIEDPILFEPTGTYEGVLVASIDLHEMLARVGTLSEPAFHSLASGETTLLTATGGSGAAPHVFEHAVIVGQPWLDGPLNLRLRFREVPEQIYAPLLLVSVAFALLVIGVVVLAAYAARRLIRTQLAPLAALGGLARSAALGQPIALPPELTRDDEVGALAKSVADMANTLRAHGEELERQVERRTQELSEAKDTAEAASRAKSEFFSRMSHELRTPLNAVLGFGQLLELYENLTPEQAGAVAEIRSAGEHLLALIDDMLDLAKIEAGGIKVTIEPVALASVLEECRVLVLPLAAERKIGLSMGQEGDGAAFVHADRTRLKQILLNLLSNALKFSRGGGFVKVRCTRSDGGVKVAVTDSGPGISRENIAKLFVPFSRLGADTAGIKGTGIGLAIAKKLIELMRGSIGVDSVIGEGSTFWFRLPAAEGAALKPPNVSVARDTASTRAEKRHSIVYVEDNPANLRLVEQILASRTNMRLFSAHEPYLGLDLIRAHKPALVLLDINLPYMDGYEMLEVIRNDPETRHIPVIAVSAAATPGEVKRGLAAGFADYVTKPLEIRKFVSILDRLLEASEAPPSSGGLTGTR